MKAQVAAYQKLLPARQQNEAEYRRRLEGKMSTLLSASMATLDSLVGPQHSESPDCPSQAVAQRTFLQRLASLEERPVFRYVLWGPGRYNSLT